MPCILYQCFQYEYKLRHPIIIIIIISVPVEAEQNILNRRQDDQTDLTWGNFFVPRGIKRQHDKSWLGGNKTNIRSTRKKHIEYHLNQAAREAEQERHNFPKFNHLWSIKVGYTTEKIDQISVYKNSAMAAFPELFTCSLNLSIS